MLSVQKLLYVSDNDHMMKTKQCYCISVQFNIVISATFKTKPQQWKISGNIQQTVPHQ